jgi:hypothetical protein
MSRPTFYAKLNVPLCWKRLIKLGFDDIEAPRAYDVRANNPKPYRRDLRQVRDKLPNGNTIWLFLASGESNYYGGVLITSPSGEHLYDMEDVIDDLDEAPFEFDDGEFNYSITFDFYGKE